MMLGEITGPISRQPGQVVSTCFEAKIWPHQESGWLTSQSTEPQTLRPHNVRHPLAALRWRIPECQRLQGFCVRPAIVPEQALKVRDHSNFAVALDRKAALKLRRIPSRPARSSGVSPKRVANSSSLMFSKRSGPSPSNVVRGLNSGISVSVAKR